MNLIKDIQKENNHKKNIIKSLVLLLFIPLFFTSFYACYAKQKQTWPLNTFELGIVDGYDGADNLRKNYQFKLRYQYLSGGVNTNQSWLSWGKGNGSFINNYIQDSYNYGFLPIFSYYQIRQSHPGKGYSDEKQAVMMNTTNKTTMTSYYDDLKKLFVELNRSNKKVVLHLEPDMWGYLQQHYGDNAKNIPVAVNHYDEFKKYNNNLSSFARAIINLRDKYASNVILGYHLSIWGTNKDIVYSNESLDYVKELATRSSNFYKSLNANFDLTFAEFTDRDSGYAQNIDNMPTDKVWYNKDDFNRHLTFIKTFNEQTKEKIILWQISLGNTLYRSMNNTPYHYQDNKVQWVLNQQNRFRNLRAYQNAGVIAMLFGSGLADNTHSLDKAKDGITNPAPINNNNRITKVSDDDGGYFREKAKIYYKSGPFKLKNKK